MRSAPQYKIEAIKAAIRDGLKCQVSLVNGLRFNIAGVISVQAYEVTLDAMGRKLTVDPEQIVSVLVFP